MKKRVSAAVSVLLVMCLMCSVTAYAVTVDEDSTSTTITYTKEAPPQSEVTQPSLPLYEIAIPAEMSLNNGDTMPIYLYENNLLSNQTLTVYIDGAKCLESDGKLHLQGTKGQSPAIVSVSYYDNNGDLNTLGGGAGLYPVAKFGSEKVHPIANGTLVLSLLNESELIADTYTGTLHFLLEVIE